MAASTYRALPSVDRVLSKLRRAGASSPDGLWLDITREVLDDARSHIAAGREAPSLARIVDDVRSRCAAMRAPPLRPLVNATGVVLHTNLGRAPLAEEAIEAMAAVARGYSNLEFDLDSGRRGSRHDILRAAALAPDRRRGGDRRQQQRRRPCCSRCPRSQRGAKSSSRAASSSRSAAASASPTSCGSRGARLVEVGTTNRTRIADYEAAITERTAALLRVHASNFRIVGFTESASLADLAELAHARGLLLLDDLGSGCLLDTARYGLAPEPTVAGHSVAPGADVVMFSGDKLLGGPQAG